MKKSTNVVMIFLAIALLANSASRLFSPTSAHAQTTNGVGGLIVLGVAPALSSCAWPAGATITNGAAFCPVAPNGLAIATNGGTFTMVGGSAAPVTSVFTRTGDVVAVSGDYSFKSIGGTLASSQLPGTMTCSATLTTPTQATFVGSAQIQSGSVALTSCK